ncbi:Protein of unknown function [Mariniphaga anaerophila]|uniref:DUF1573 domain-containing protein n=1 Tax=Mariniphaga anaerophila TaxID=1484053 RepID=A0A1M4VEI4_9BACT|nr:DUF1573 domain-containing protein [Mariniphaga anaerophila]SHE67345.1 Protein of unknown function [Mariniphaga anaerophila]
MKQMLRLIFAFGFVALTLSVMAQKPQIVFENLEHDFGSFKEADGVQTTTFKFTNKGDVPLVLSNVRASCGCTTPKWTREPVAPNGTGQIDVSYNPKNRPGSFNKTVMVSSNAENGTTVLRITGRVEERERTLAELYPREVGSLRVKTNHISFARIKENEEKTQDLELVNDTDKPIKVGFRTVPPHLTAKVEPETIPAHSKGKLFVTYDAKKAGTYGFASHRLYLTLDGSNDYRASIGVSATIEEDFSALSADQLAKAPVAKFSESSHDFGEMKQGDKKDHTFTLTNDGKTDLIIRNVRSSCGCTAVAPSKKVIAPGESAPIKVTFDSRGKRGRQSKSVTVITNDPKTPTSMLRISCNITT